MIKEIMAGLLPGLILVGTVFIFLIIHEIWVDLSANKMAKNHIDKILKEIK